MTNAVVQGVYQPRTIKRDRRTSARIAQLEQQNVDVLSADHQQSVRHVFYLMTNPRLPEPVEKSERGYRHVQDRCTKLRRDGVVPYGWIGDATRRGYHTPTYPTAADFLNAVSGLYRADLWQDSRWYVEVWCESRSIAGVIENDCREMAVSLYPAGGFSSITLAFQAAEQINAVTDNGAQRDVNILYIGDYGPSGVLIDETIERELRQHLHPDVDMNFERIAINEAQIDAHNLPSKRRKPSDKRAQHVTASVEAEAMPARLLRQLLRESIEGFLPPHALEVARAAEASEREHLTRMANLLGGAA